MKIEVRKEQEITHIVNALYPTGVNHIGNLRFPDIGVDYLYLQWSDTPWEESYYVDLNNNLYDLTDAMLIVLTVTVTDWVQDEGQEGNLTVDQEKVKKINELQLALETEVINLLGVEGAKETESFTTQEREARAWDADNLIATPFIDALLTARSLAGETKQQLVGIIIFKADLFAVSYATLLGKFHKLTKQVEVAVDKTEISAITWS